VGVTAPQRTGDEREACRSLVEALPEQVAGQQLRAVEPASALAGAWGDPPIVARCGVAKPAGLRPTSRCDVVNAVGWFSRRTSDGYVFTTIGRSAYVEVAVPDAYEPAANALVDLAPAVKRHVPVVRRCV
jgi:hypothetical protein